MCVGGTHSDKIGHEYLKTENYYLEPKYTVVQQFKKNI